MALVAYSYKGKEPWIDETKIDLRIKFEEAHHQILIFSNQLEEANDQKKTQTLPEDIMSTTPITSPMKSPQV